MAVRCEPGLQRHPGLPDRSGERRVVSEVPDRGNRFSDLRDLCSGKVRRDLVPKSTDAREPELSL